MTELSPEAKALIEQVSLLDDPTAADRARIRNKLALQMGAAAFATSTVAAASTGQGALASAKGALFGTMGKVALCAGALCVVGGALLLDWPGGERKGARKGVSTPATQVQPPAAPAVDAPAQAPVEIAEVTPVVSEVAPPRAAKKRALNKSEPAVTVQPDVHAPVPNTLAQELQLLQSAQAALRKGSFEQALLVAEEHAQRFPTGVLSEERAGIRALARCELKRGDDSEAKSFLQQSPASPLAARVRKACGLP